MGKEGGDSSCSFLFAVAVWKKKHIFSIAIKVSEKVLFERTQ